MSYWSPWRELRAGQTRPRADNRCHALWSVRSVLPRVNPMRYRETFDNPCYPCARIPRQCSAEYCKTLSEVGQQVAPARSRGNAAPLVNTQRPVVRHAAKLLAYDDSAQQEDRRGTANHRIILSHPVPGLLETAVRLKTSLCRS